jgi:hypothetical protein
LKYFGGVCMMPRALILFFEELKAASSVLPR